MNADDIKGASGALKVARTLSLIAATAVVAVVVFFPRAIAPDSASVPHGWFVLMMMGMSICWICGFGFTPENRWLRKVFSLPVGWIMLLTGVWQIFS